MSWETNWRCFNARGMIYTQANNLQAGSNPVSFYPTLLYYRLEHFLVAVSLHKKSMRTVSNLSSSSGYKMHGETGKKMACRVTTTRQWWYMHNALRVRPTNLSTLLCLQYGKCIRAYYCLFHINSSSSQNQSRVKTQSWTAACPFEETDTDDDDGSSSSKNTHTSELLRQMFLF